jgi:protein ImuB
MLWACLRFSDLPLRAVFDDGEQAQACALIDGPRQRQHIVFINAQAERNGIRLNQPLAAARAVCSNLQARVRDPKAEKRLLHSLAAWAYRFSSHVSLCEPDSLLIEVGASLHLFGGWPKLEHRLRRELARIKHAPLFAVAPTPMAAQVLATQCDGFFTAHREPMLEALKCVPLVNSGLQEKIITLLYSVGMRTLRDVFALPRPELARRIGPAALAQLDRMRGIHQEALPLYQPPDRFEHRIELDDRVEAWPPLLFPLRRLCGELSLFLTARDGGVQRCELVLDHEGHTATRVAIELLTPQREARTLYELIRSRLERVVLKHPICAIALIAKDLPTLRPQHQDLFETKRAQALDWPELAERLRAHLGDNAVRRLAQAADHRPERAWRCDIEAKSTAELRLRPLWLLPRILPLRGPAPRILAGPERIESGWWDGADARRDYYVVQTREGQRAWAFLAAGASDGWMLHGWFA